MRKIMNWKLGWIVITYVLLDGLATGAGMGVPIFNILFGFPVGWYLARRLRLHGQLDRDLMQSILKWSALTAGVTLLMMLAIWAPTAVLLFDPSADLANFGIPMILFEPEASFIGWLILMILISPFLQFLMSIFGAQVVMATQLEKDKP